MPRRSRLTLSLLALLVILGGTAPEAAAQRARRPDARQAPARKAQARATTPRPDRQDAARGAARLQRARDTHAGDAAVGQLRGRFRQVLESSGAQFFERSVHGQQRFVANVSGRAEIDAVSALAQRGSNVLQLVHIGDPAIRHTMAIFDGELVHTQHITGTGNWRLREWGDAIRPSSKKMYSAFIELSADEAQSLRDHIRQAREDQGPEHQAGPNWERGKLADTSLGGCRSVNCVSTWTEMPLGQSGRQLWEIIGLDRSYSNNARGLHRALETGGNGRVIGLAVYGPRIERFEADPDRTIFEF